MKKETGSIAFIVGFSSLIGTALTLSFWMHFKWNIGWGCFLIPFGALISGLSAYLGYDFKKTQNGITKCWIVINNKVIKWRPNWSWWEETAIIVIYGIFYSLTGILISLAVSHFPKQAQWITRLSENKLADLVTFIEIITIGYGIILTLIALRKRTKSNFASHKYIVTFGNPIILPFTILFGILYVILLAICNVKQEIEFFKRLFIYTYCEKRRICLISTATGVILGCMVGYRYFDIFYGAIAGLIIGPILGVIQYHLITIRWLNLRTASSSD
jgi:hypothetical protein